MRKQYELSGLPSPLSVSRDNRTYMPIAKGSDVMFRSGELHKDQVRHSTEDFYNTKIEKAKRLGLVFPCTEREVIEFVEELAYNYKYTTINGYVSAIKWYHADNDLPFPKATPLLDATMVGLRKKKIESGERVRQSEPFTYDDLKEACHYFDTHRSPIHRRNKVILMLMYYGSLRRSELAGMDFEDVVFKRHGCLIHLKVSKNNKNEVFIPRDVDNENLCPVACFEKFMTDYFSNYKGAVPIFRSCHSSGRSFKDCRITTNAISSMVKDTMEKLGHSNWNSYSGHAPRRGFVTDAVLENVNHVKIGKNARMSLSGVELYSQTNENETASEIMRRKSGK